jgi:hypothetical protein
MNENVNATVHIVETVGKSIEAIYEMYMNSTPEERKQILKTLGAMGGYALFIRFLNSL